MATIGRPDTRTHVLLRAFNKTTRKYETTGISFTVYGMDLKTVEKLIKKIILAQKS